MNTSIEKLERDELLVWFGFQYGDATLSDVNKLVSILQYLNDSIWPKPISATYSLKTRTKKIEITSFLDPKLLTLLEKPDSINTYEIWFNEKNYKLDNNFLMVITQAIKKETLIGYCQLFLKIPFSLNHNPTDLKELILSLLQLMPSVYFVDTGSASEISYWQDRNTNWRTINFNNLCWLQYFSATEIAIQGGMEEWEANPLLHCERIHDGLLVQVGNSPYDIYTPEGQARLLQANDSLPPVNQELYAKEEARKKPFLGKPIF